MCGSILESSIKALVFFFAKHILLAMGYTPLQISAVNLSGAYRGNLFQFGASGGVSDSHAKAGSEADN